MTIARSPRPGSPGFVPVLPLFAALIAANLAAWFWAWSAFAQHPVLLGTALLAWVFGLRHAVDADHIAAIDNITRTMLARGERRRAMHVGLHFSLGHSSVVFLATLAVAAGATALQGGLDGIRALAGPIGGGVSALFLLLIAGVNLAILRGVWRSFRRVRAGGAMADEDLNTLLAATGPLARLLRPVLRLATRGRHIYMLGFLFGLGFDTATEIGLLGIAATQSASLGAHGLSTWQILVFPALFAAGMALVDTADNVLMVRAYAWAFTHPLRKLWYNLTVTAASVIVALLIGGIEAMGMLAEIFSLDGWPWGVVAGLNRNLAGFGFLIVGVFALCWAVSATVYRWKGYDAVVERV